MTGRKLISWPSALSRLRRNRPVEVQYIGTDKPEGFPEWSLASLDTSTGEDLVVVHGGAYVPSLCNFRIPRYTDLEDAKKPRKMARVPYAAMDLILAEQVGVLTIEQIKWKQRYDRALVEEAVEQALEKIRTNKLF